MKTKNTLMNNDENQNIKGWNNTSWKQKEIKQQPHYTDEVALEKVKLELSKKEHIVSFDEINQLKQLLHDVHDSKALILQGGDCAETFKEYSKENVTKHCQLINQMASFLEIATKKPVIKISRIAGQFCKPRSSDTETKNNITLDSYRGDIINSEEFSEKARKANPHNMIKAYHQSVETKKQLEDFMKQNQNSYQFLDAEKIKLLQNNDTLDTEKQKILNEILQGQNNQNTKSLNLINPKIKNHLFISHESLLLDYEQQFVKLDTNTQKYYLTSAHMVWLGERTRGLNEAHVEFVRGLENPIGVKISDKITEDELIQLVNIINPNNEKGKMILIIRMGHSKVLEKLPALIKALQKEKSNVILTCDPMHGNVETIQNIKTRQYHNILSEINNFIKVNQECNNVIGGFHFEMTGQDVIECLGGKDNITQKKLIESYDKSYLTSCDPRLNLNQSLEISLDIAQYLN